MGLTLRKYEPLPDITVQGNNYQAPSVSLAPVQAPAQNIGVANYGHQPTNNWGPAPVQAPSFFQQPLQTARGLLESPFTVPKFVFNSSLDAAKALTAAATANTLARNNSLQKLGQDYNTLADTPRQFVTRPAVQLASSLAPKQLTVRPTNKASRVLLGSTPVQNIEKGVASTYNNHPGLNPVARVGLAGAYGAGQLAQDLPVATGAFKGAKDLKAYDTAQNQIGAVGKNVNKPNVPEVPKGAAKLTDKQILKGFSDVRSKFPNDKAFYDQFVVPEASKNTRSADLAMEIIGQVENDGLPHSAAIDNSILPDKPLPSAYHQARDELVGVASRNKQPQLIKQFNEASNGMNEAEKTALLQKSLNDFRAKGGGLVDGRFQPTQGAKPTAEQASLDATAPTLMDKVMANTTGVTPKVAMAERVATHKRGMLNLEAERAALTHLQEGGNRDGAVKIYAGTAGVSPKMATLRVAQASKRAKVALKPNAETPNVLLKDYTLDTAKPGEYNKAPFNRTKVNNNIDLNHRIVTKDINKLTPNDRANFIAYKQGTKTLNSAKNPVAVQKAISSTQHLFDVVHAFDTAAGGTTRHIKDFFPDYWNYQDPATAMRLEEARVVNRNADPETSNYGGFHNKNRMFANRQEGLDAGFQPLHTDPLQDINRYVSGAKLTVGDQAFKNAVADANANVDSTALKHTIDLPSGQGIKVDRQGNRALKNESLKAEPNVALKAYDKGSRLVVNTIVANPIFHGGNQLIQTLIASGRIPLKVLGGKGQSSVLGMAKLTKHMAQYAASKEYRAAGTAEYFAEGGHIPSYGTYQKGLIYKTFNTVKAGGITKVSPSAMREIERAFRVSAYKASKASGMDGLEAVKNIDHYLGDSKAMSDAAYRAGLFLHYAKTMGGSLYGHARHPIQEAGATSNALALVGIIAGLNYGWQQVTGNKDASVRAPGEIGFAEQIIKSKAQAQRGQVPSLVTNRVNPLIKYPAELASNRDLSKPVTGPSAATVFGPKGEGAGALAAKDLFGPGQSIQRTDKGQASPTETGLSLATGFYTPHAKGYQAAPKLAALNSKDAKPGTGLDERNAYFKGQDRAYKVLGNDANNIYAFNSIKEKNHTPDGKTIMREPKETMTDANTYFSNDAVRKASQISETANKSHDPQWDLSPDRLKTWFDYQKNVKDSAEQNYIVDHNPWIRDVQDKRSKFFNSLNSKDLPVPSKFDQQHPFPLSDGEFKTMIAAAKIDDPQEKSQYYMDHPELTNIDQRYGKYINAIRDNQGAPPLPAPPQPPPGVEDIIAQYNALPKNDGPKGGSKTRSLWIKAHPDAWAQVTNFYTRSSLYNLVKQAAAEQLNGDAAGNQKLLKAAYSLGQFDIAKNSDGTYSLGTGGSSGSSGSSSKNFSYNNKPSTFNQNRATIKLSSGGKVSTPTLSVPKGKAKVAKKSGPSKPKVALKSLRV